MVHPALPRLVRRGRRRGRPFPRPPVAGLRLPFPGELAAWCLAAPRWAHDLGAGARWDYVATWSPERFEPGPDDRHDLREPAPGAPARVLEDLLTATDLESATGVPADFDALLAGETPDPHRARPRGGPTRSRPSTPRCGPPPDPETAGPDDPLLPPSSAPYASCSSA